MMKTKKLNKKLSLNKKTVTTLDNRELDHQKAGCGKTDVQSGCPRTYTCFITCYATCDPTCEDATCATQTGTPESDPCCLTC